MSKFFVINERVPGTGLFPQGVPDDLPEPCPVSPGEQRPVPTGSEEPLLPPVLFGREVADDDGPLLPPRMFADNAATDDSDAVPLVSPSWNWSENDDS